MLIDTPATKSEMKAFSTSLRAFADAYDAFCNAHGEDPLPYNRLRLALAVKYNFRTEHYKSVHIVGIRLKDAMEAEHKKILAKYGEEGASVWCVFVVSAGLLVGFVELFVVCVVSDV